MMLERQLYYFKFAVWPATLLNAFGDKRKEKQ